MEISLTLRACGPVQLLLLAYPNKCQHKLVWACYFEFSVPKGQKVVSRGRKPPELIRTPPKPRRGESYSIYHHILKSGTIANVALSQYSRRLLSGFKTVILICMFLNLLHFKRIKSKGISPNSNANIELATRFCLP